MVSKGDLAHAVSFLSGDPPTSLKGGQDVGSLVLYQFCLCRGLRRSSCLFLWLAGISLSRVCVFPFNWGGPSSKSLDLRTINLPLWPRNVSLLRNHQSRCGKQGLPQRASRSALCPVEQSSKTARDGSGILQQPEISFI